MRKKIIIILILLALIGGAITATIIERNKREEQAGAVQLEILYKWQNRAFEMSCSSEEYLDYLPADRICQGRLTVELFIYNYVQDKYQLTFDEVLDYLSEEYDSDGKLRVYSRPEEIEDYIHAYPEVEEMSTEFGDYFFDYMRAHEYPVCSVSEMSYEEVANALEEYENAPEYHPPHDPHEKDEQDTSDFELTPEISNEIRLKKMEMEEAGCSEEEIEETINQIISEYKDGE